MWVGKVLPCCMGEGEANNSKQIKPQPQTPVIHIAGCGQGRQPQRNAMTFQPAYLGHWLRFLATHLFF